MSSCSFVVECATELLAARVGGLHDDGHISVPDVPGIGVGINENAMRQYAAKDVPSFE